MPPHRIVEHVDLVKDILLCFYTGAVCFVSNPFPLEQREEALGNGVIVAAPAPAHALVKIVLIQEVAPIVATELTSLAGMHRHRFLGLPTPNSH